MSEECDLQRCKLQEAHIRKLEEIHVYTKEILTYARHLEKLDALSDIRDHLISVATGKDHIQSKIAIMLFKILGAVILCLIGIIVFLLVGEQWGLIGALHR